MAIEIALRKAESAEAGTRRGQMRALWRLGGWGATAAIALMALAFVSRSETGSQRLALMLASAHMPVRTVATLKVPPPRPEKDTETRRLEAQLRALADDRDRLAARIGSLEHHLEDVTGSIARQAAEKRAAPEPKPAPTPSATAAMEAPKAPAAPPPNVSPLFMPPIGETAVWFAPQQQAAAAAPEPDAAPAPERVPLPPVRVATAPTVPEAPPKPEFGVSFTGSSSVAVIRLQWAALKANFGTMLAGLYPHAVHERRNGATHYRLVLGPLPNYGAAAKLCARLVAAHATCRPVKFVGERL